MVNNWLTPDRRFVGEDAQKAGNGVELKDERKFMLPGSAAVCCREAQCSPQFPLLRLSAQHDARKPRCRFWHAQRPLRPMLLAGGDDTMPKHEHTSRGNRLCSPGYEIF